MSSQQESLLIFGVVLAAALLGMSARFILPDHHRAEPTRINLLAAVSVVGTLTALVLSLAFSNASASRMGVLRTVLSLSAAIQQMDDQLRNFGPEAEPARATLAQYATQKLGDLFPPDATISPNLVNPATASLLDRLQDEILQLQPHSDPQRWRQTQALTLSQQLAAAHWSLAEEALVTMPPAGFAILTLWLAILFATFGLFMPVHSTSLIGLSLTAVTMASAVFMTLEAHKPFTGIVRIPSTSLVQAVAALHK